MVRARTWTVEITITEHADERRTHADAVVRSARPLPHGAGDARRRPADQEVPEIGDELATARALADLAYKVLDAAADDIEHVTHRPMRMLS
ncbi:DUF1876 domain-containing protein [Actinoplanes sp. NPDC048967]|uniref:DUF1876 domain-containing protein n=1 Tax=Actinoplanes sp. NPDC048967 TaxID=3155269 RepID=UPI0033C0BD13